MAPVPGTESYLVIGGCGFVGRHIIEALLARGETQVGVFDIVQRHFDSNVSFYIGDITKADEISGAMKKSAATVVIHTASPIHGLGQAIYEKVNIVGTRTVIATCVENGIKKLVFTSSAGVVFSGTEEVVDVDERLDFPAIPMDAYNETKARAEALVLGANGRDGLMTCALRPAGIFGPGDRQLISGFASVLTNKQTGWQIGDNNNLFDWTYVGNVAHAHILAADRLGTSVPMVSFDEPLPALNTSQTSRIPTSNARPVGPKSNPSPEDIAVGKAYEDPSTLAQDDTRPVLRTRFDQFANPAPTEDDLEDEKPIESINVAGQAFFITNCEPMYFWDFGRAIWAAMGHVDASHWELSPSTGMWLATLAEGWAKLVGKEAGFTKFRVKFASSARYYNVERARRVLGYEPIVGVQEGIDRTMEWWNKQEAEKKALKA
ncbi:3-beta hydroxysteroid dehydrogenase/isomerase family-domain-containing protein [Mrakia frigida]|uniref:sterol-4-alpha-carboxylate 3-dehydrogenase (decarboxylating) n=1 Tax=Mrakia frigida TaxID=29902 RepID=UPI003FCC109C